jgi:hypothetical protein
MAVYRPTPTCQFCGKPIAKAIRKSYGGLPGIFQSFGDNFSHWQYKRCNCKKAKKLRKKLRKKVKPFLEAFKHEKLSTLNSK